MITVKLLASLRKLAGDRELTVPLKPGGTVSDLLQAIGEVYPGIRAKVVDEDGELTGTVQVLLNGRNVLWLDGLDTIIDPEQTITLIPPVAGG
jgi:sulfur-carrier protein